MMKDLSREQYQFIIKEIQAFFLRERQEKLSESEVERILLIINDTISPILYNTIIDDVFNIIERHVINLEDGLLKLKLSTNKSLN